jgi:hypothetical protein
MAVAYRGGLVRKLLVDIEEYEVSIRAKLSGGCDALLLALVGVLQVGLLLGFGSVASEAREPVDYGAYQQYVEVVVVEASKIVRG